MTTSKSLNNFSLPKLCFGGWQASGWTNSHPEKFVLLLRDFFEHGYCFVDTAPVYGEGLSEKLVGQVIQDYDRSKIIIATKFWPSDSSPERLELSIENSLRRLNTDYIDIYQQHWPSSKVNLDEMFASLNRLKDAGKIRAIGVSNWLKPEWADTTNITDISYAQLCYSLLWRNCEPEVTDLIKNKNIGLLAYSPLCQGLLSQNSLPTQIPNDYRAKNIFYKGEFKNTVERVLKLVTSLANKYSVSNAQIALAWLLAKSYVASVIVGVTNQSQLIDNIEVTKLKLENEDIKMLDQISWPIAENIKPHDTLWRWRP